MKEKMKKEIVRIGSEHVKYHDLKAVEAVTMSVVALLSIALGAIYGSLLF